MFQSHRTTETYEWVYLHMCWVICQYLPIAQLDWCSGMQGSLCCCMHRGGAAVCQPFSSTLALRYLMHSSHRAALHKYEKQRHWPRSCCELDGPSSQTAIPWRLGSSCGESTRNPPMLDGRSRLCATEAPGMGRCWLVGDAVKVASEESQIAEGSGAQDSGNHVHWDRGRQGKIFRDRDGVGGAVVV